MVYSEGVLLAETCAENVDLLDTKGESDPEASGERELSALHFDFPIESFLTGGPLYGVTEVVQILRFHIKSVILNELLFKTRAGLNQYPYAVESLRVTFSFENGVRGGQVCLPRLKELSPEPDHADINIPNVPQPRHSPGVNPSQHTIPATLPTSETHGPCTVAPSGGSHPPLNPEYRLAESTQTQLPPTKPNILYSTSPGSHIPNSSSILFQPLPATPPAAPPYSHSSGPPRHNTHLLHFISTSTVTAAGRYAPYPSPQPSGRMKCAILPSRKVAHPRTRTPALPPIEPLGHFGAVEGNIDSDVNVGLMAPPPSRLPVAPRLPSRGLPHSKQPNVTSASSVQQVGQRLVTVDRALHALTPSESRSTRSWQATIGPAAPISEFKFLPIRPPTLSAQGSNFAIALGR